MALGAQNRLARRLLAVGCLVVAGGCTDASEVPPSAENLIDASVELPWEVRSEAGETVLPNVYYAEATENEQVMPTAVAGYRGIDRLIYPTIGNPNLYVRSDESDSLLVVLRMEPDAIAHLNPTKGDAVEHTARRRLQLSESAQDKLAFYLVSRAGRDEATTRDSAIGEPDGQAVYEVHAAEIQADDSSATLPDAFRDRMTLRCFFRKDDLSQVPAGLYDLRVEVLRDGELAVPAEGRGELFEYQYNAVRIFETGPEDGAYTIVSVTDTQLSTGTYIQGRSEPELRGFVDFVRSGSDPDIAHAAFVTFNGDLHNGGSPFGIREEYVATTYAEEARVIVEVLRELPLPIFLTPGNHDGYVSMGHVPESVDELSKGDGLRSIVEAAEPKAWPNFSWNDLALQLDQTKNERGGRPRDIFSGAHVRRVDPTSEVAWQSVDRAERNVVLYDGFYQWQKSYGPLFASWKWGDNRYLSVNSYDLRQHRRAGWGVYTVNYGGGVSPTQLDWIRRELERAEATEDDVVVLAHHDPRGGHKGSDFGFYFPQVTYRGLGQSAAQYLEGKVLEAVVCKLPDWALKDSLETDCLHDGLQEWMRPDLMFDCAVSDMGDDGRCRAEIATPSSQAPSPVFSGIEFAELMATHPSIRTLLLGHTHYNSMEVLQSGDRMVPVVQGLSSEEQERLAAANVTDPVRAQAYSKGDEEGYDPEALRYEDIASELSTFFPIQKRAVAGKQLTLGGDGRELVVLRLTSNADLTGQKYNGAALKGFSVLGVSRHADERNYRAGQIQSVGYFIDRDDGQFEKVATLPIVRTVRLKSRDANNPVEQLLSR